ncbi:MAG TPA: DUF3298 domain-containing protein [Pyrinomonadaceae bacterium]|jgi:hypothetical protein
MMLKKLTHFFLLLTLIFSLQSCQRKDDASQQSGDGSQAKGNNGQGGESMPAGGTLPAGTAINFRGNIGGENKIEMKLVRDGERLSGTYFYSKVGSNLEVRGTIDKQGNLMLKEFDASGTQTGLFKGKWTDSETEGGVFIEGNWSKPDGSKEATFYVTEQHVEFSNGLSVVSKEIKEENKKARYRLDVEYPQLQGAAGGSAEAFNHEVSSRITKEINEWKSGAGLEAGEEDLSYDAPEDSFDESYDVRLANNDLVSIIFYVSVYEHGAAHPSSYSSVINYDLKQGRTLKLANLFKPGASYLQSISAYSIKDLKRQAAKVKPDDSLLTDESIEEGATPTEDNYQNWNITAKGLMITFDPYQVGPYAAGPQRVIIPYSALRDILDPNGPVAPLMK